MTTDVPIARLDHRESRQAVERCIHEHARAFDRGDRATMRGVGREGSTLDLGAPGVFAAIEALLGADPHLRPWTANPLSDADGIAGRTARTVMARVAPTPTR